MSESFTAIEKKIAAKVEKAEDHNALSSFSGMLIQLFENLRAVFPECEATASKVEQLKFLLQGEDEALQAHKQKDLVYRWNTAVAPVYEGVTKGDASAIEGLCGTFKEFVDIGLWEKWSAVSFDDTSRDNLLQYIQSLCVYGKMYDAMPKGGFMDKIESVSRKYADKPMEVSTVTDMTREMLQSLTSDDLENFGSNMESILGSLGGAEGLGALLKNPAMNPFIQTAQQAATQMADDDSLKKILEAKRK